MNFLLLVFVGVGAILIADVGARDGGQGQCENILNDEMCNQLQVIASSRNIPFHQVELMMHASRAKGMRKPEQLYASVLTYLAKYGDETYHDTKVQDTQYTGVHDVHDIKYVGACTDLLPSEKCEELTKMALKLKLDKSDLIKGLTDSKFQGAHDTETIYNKVKEYFNMEIQCLTILDHERCGAIRLIAMKEKIPFREVERKLKRAQSRGMTDKQQLYQAAMDYLNSSEDEMFQASHTKVEMVRQVNDDATSCQKVLSKGNCVELVRLAQIFGVSGSEGVVDAAVTDAQLQGAEKIADIMTKANQFLEDRSFCDYVMKVKMCADLQSSSAALGVPFHDVRMYINDLYMNRGVKTGKKLYTMTKTYIRGASDAKNDETSDCKADHGKNTCMVLLKSVMQCLSLKIFSWKGGLAPSDVTTSLKNTCLSGGGKTNLYKRTIAVLRCRIYCKIGKVDKSCAKVYKCQKELKEKPKDLVIGIVGNNNRWGSSRWGNGPL